MFSYLRGNLLVVNQIIIVIVLLLLAGAGFYSLSSMSKSATQMGLGKDVVADILPPPLYLIEAELVVTDLQQANATARQPLLEKLRSLKKDYDTRNQYWEDIEVDHDVRSSLLGEQRQQADLFWQETQNNFIPAIEADNTSEASASAKRLRGLYEAHRKGVDATVSFANAYASNKLDNMATITNQGYWALAIMTSAGLLVILALSIPIIRRIYRGLRVASDVSSTIASGDLASPVPATSQDEVGAVIAQLASMRSKLHAIVQQLSGASIQLATAAEETSAITTQTSANLRQQQSETEQVATAMNEMNATVREVARNANDAAAAAHNADDETRAGKQIVTQTIATINNLAKEVAQAADVIRQLEQESVSIGTVLDVIRGIAEQTNLLALNAAIEAARAGEQGRGFAVVADEVRTLASRTQKSTAEIQVMIQKLQAGTSNAVKVMESSTNQAQAGAKQVSQAGVSLDAITRAVATINDMNAQIASAAEEQSAVADEINRNIVNISQSTEQSNHGAQQTATASEELARLAGQLHAMVGQFKI